jgi:hypothetical protein
MVERALTNHSREGRGVTFKMEDQMDKNIPDIGQNAPEFEALTSERKIFKLSEELKSGQNVKLVFYRGHW